MYPVLYRLRKGLWLCLWLSGVREVEGLIGATSKVMLMYRCGGVGGDIMIKRSEESEYYHQQYQNRNNEFIYRPII